MKNLTKGNPIKLIVQFAIPLFIGRILQILYAIVDTRIVGVTLGDTAIAAVGGTSTLADLLLEFTMGMTAGFSIIVANSFGAGNEKNVKRSVARTFILTGGFSLGLSALALVFLDRILGILHVPANIYDNARSYIFVILAGLIFSALYNACAAVLRAVGDTVTPLIFLVISSLLNVGLDCYFIMVLRTGVWGAAAATVIAQGFSFVLCFIYMWKKYPGMRFSAVDLEHDGDMLSRMLKAGVSMGFMSAFVSFGTVSLQTAINTFGTDIIVAHTAARKITMIFMMPFGVFGMAMATYCGQNMGAGEYGRIRTGLKKIVLMTWGICILVIILANTVAGNLVTLITGSETENVIKYATLYLRFDTAFYFVPTFIALVRNSLQGIGDSTTPVVSSFIELAGKVVIALTLAPAVGYWGIIVAEPIVWILMVIPLIVAVVKNPVFKAKNAENKC